MKKNPSAINPRPFSSLLFDGDERAAARSMLYPIGFQAGDFKKPLIGIASTWSDVTPCTSTNSRVNPKKARTKAAARRLFSTPSPSPTAFPWARKA